MDLDTARFRQVVTPSADDIDELGRVGNLAFVRWAEASVRAHAQSVKFGATELEAAGIAFVVAEHHFEYLRASIGTLPISVDGCVSLWTRASFTYRTSFVREGGPENVRGHSKWVCIRRQDGRPVKIPDDVRSALSGLARTR